MKTIRVGRSHGNDIVINDRHVGRRHCEFVKDETGVIWVLDLNSKNGTYINGVRRSSKTELRNKDEVRIGKTILPWESYFQSTAGTRHITPRVITIGRSPDNNLFINDPKASRFHCRIECYDNYTFVLEDVGSKNGTFVNGARINRRTPLRSGDQVKIGSTNVPWEHYINPGGTIDGGSYTGTGTGVVVEPVIGSISGKSHIEPPIDTPTETLGIWTFLFGLASIGCIIYIVVNYLTSVGYQLVNTFGGTGDSLKLFPIYLRGYLGIGGQWMPMIAAVGLGILTDLIDFLSGEKKDSLASFGNWLANAAIGVGGIFILLAIFAEEIVKSL